MDSSTKLREVPSQGLAWEFTSYQVSANFDQVYSL
jgi:hypothetical protein